MTVPGTPEQAVVDAVAGRVPDWFGPGARLRSNPAVQRRPWSVHVLPTVVADGREIDLIVKIPLWVEAPNLAAALHAGPQESTGAEYEMLRRIEAMVAAADDPRLTAVRPVGSIDEINAVVTERLESETLRRLPLSGRVEAGRAIGAWLRRFHDEIGGASTKPATRDDLDAIFGLGDPAVPVTDAQAEALAAVRGQAMGMLGHSMRCATTHGDLGPSNILVTADGRVAVIDPNLVRGPVESDLAKLAIALRTGRLRLPTGVPDGRRLHPVEEAVLDGYGRVSDEIYGLCRRAAAVRRWQEVETGSRGVRRWALPMARRVMRAETR